MSVGGDQALGSLFREEKQVSTFYFGRLFFVNSDWSGAGNVNRLPTCGSNSGWIKVPDEQTAGHRVVGFFPIAQLTAHYDTKEAFMRLLLAQ